MAMLVLSTAQAEEGERAGTSLTGRPGDPARGREIVVSREHGLCLLCHSGPFPQERFQGDLATDLSGAGTRWTASELRLRLMDPQSLDPASIMPAYYRTEGLTRVGAGWRGRTVLSAGQIEDVVAFLMTLRDPNASEPGANGEGGR
ncbi:MAG: sulfur oxidation c-type cytochrome SoxX [Gammaproteobacteria bacterium]